MAFLLSCVRRFVKVVAFFIIEFYFAIARLSLSMTGYVKSLWHAVFGEGGHVWFLLISVLQGGGHGQAAGVTRHIFPDTIEGFGYHFNKDGKLVDRNGGRFQFVVRKDDPEYNQQRYVALGELVTEHVYKLLEDELKLEKVYVPVDAKQGEARSFIFQTRDAAVNTKLMVLIHGSGVVRAGQWSRKLIINENMDTGSQLPYIRRAVDDGFGVIVMNTNLNEDLVDGKLQKVRGSESPEQHGEYVWRHFVQPAKARGIALVAHSYGGIVAFSIAESFLRDFQKRVFSVVFTDSVHADREHLWSRPVKAFMKQRAVNFVSSSEPLDVKESSSSPDDCLAVSAGTPEHERTSDSCIKSAFQFITRNFEAWVVKGTTVPHLVLPDSVKVKSEL